MAKDLAAKFKKIERQAYQAGIKAMQDIAQIAVNKAIDEVAMNCLRRYYAYYKPEMYIRTDSLKNSITPIFVRNGKGNGAGILFGVHFDASQLEGVYHSNSWYHQSGGKWVSSNSKGFNWNSQSNGIVDPQWVVDNFLLGRHPVMYGFKPDPTTTHEVMTDFFKNDMKGLLAELVNIEFPKAVKKFLDI